VYKAYSLRVDENLFKNYLEDGRLVKKENNSAAKNGLDKFFDGDGSLVAKK